MFEYNIKELDYNITDDPDELDDQNDISPEFLRKLQRYHDMALKGKKSSIPKILHAIKKHPRNPQLKNYLSVLYGQLNRTQKVYDVNKWIVAEHPDYLFGKLNLANEYWLKEEYDKIIELLGPEMDLKALYPDRRTFHIVEVMGVLRISILYYTGVGDMEEADARFDLMKKLAPDSDETKNMGIHIFDARMRAGQKRYEEEQKAKISVVSAPQKITPITAEPSFIHKEIKALYENGLHIEREILETILSLPRKTLLKDLESVLLDSINRYSYFKENLEKEGWEEENMDFVIHAIYILGELKASESIDVVFNVLSQSDEYLEFYFGDFITEGMWEPFFNVASNDLKSCKEFMCKPGNTTFSRSVITDMVCQVALHNSERRDEAIDWFDDIMRFFLKSELSDNVIDSDLIAFMICDLIEMKGDKLLPLIEEMFQKGIVSTGVCGHWEDVKETFCEPKEYTQKKEILNIFDRYMDITSTWAGYKEEEVTPEVNYDGRFDAMSTPLKVERKIGRNEPCPCGSGKKYKKCCINN